ncbi:hypothetical protein [Desulfopila sp. IMCC35006]|uniref:hypothetical protein n=1 Tax=Desulfopila sp. IMCC35006 TaxID=2569542 RepID=UPI0012946F79|nr:hypothetical protein [Desulfopila sp. IMCC35006]
MLTHNLGCVHCIICVIDQGLEVVPVDMATGIIAVILVRIVYRERTRFDSFLTHIW